MSASEANTTTTTAIMTGTTPKSGTLTFYFMRENSNYNKSKKNNFRFLCLKKFGRITCPLFNKGCSSILTTFLLLESLFVKNFGLFIGLYSIPTVTHESVSDFISYEEKYLKEIKWNYEHK
jgi:hypothetical protein